MLTNDVVYNGYDNTIERVLWADGDVPSLTGVTRMVLDFGDGLTVDSSIDASAFDWTQTVTDYEASLPVVASLGIVAGDPKLVLSLGQSLIPAGSYNAALIVYDAANPHGIVWGRMRIVVK